MGLKIRTSEMYEFPTGMNSFPTHIQVIHFETLHIAETACFILFTLPLQCKHPIPLAFGMSWSTKLGPREGAGILWQPCAGAFATNVTLDNRCLESYTNSGVWCSWFAMIPRRRWRRHRDPRGWGHTNFTLTATEPVIPLRSMEFVRSPKCETPKRILLEVVCPRNPTCEKESFGCCLTSALFGLRRLQNVSPVAAREISLGFLTVNQTREWLTVFRHTLGVIFGEIRGNLKHEGLFLKRAWGFALDVANSGEAFHHNSDMERWHEHRTFATFPK